jgi:DNA-binding MarR family transcriptional regulator
MIVMCKNSFMEKSKPKQPFVSPAFLLSQVGAHAAFRFADRLAPLGLSPHHAGILGRVGASPGLSQQQLSDLLGIHPSRLVAIVDELESMGFVERRENADDRRSHALHLTDRGKATLAEIGKIGREHGTELCAALTREEREELVRLLGLIAEQQGLTPGVHPGYRRLGVARDDGGGGKGC